MFLEKAELNTVGTIEVINLITGSVDEIITNIILENIDIISTYLHQYYDTEAIFSATGDDRNLSILKHLKAMVIHAIYKRRSKTMNESAKEDYDEAMMWLEKVGKGEIKPNLPVRVNTVDGLPVEATFLKLGSRKNYPNHF